MVIPASAESGRATVSRKQKGVSNGFAGRSVLRQSGNPALSAGTAHNGQPTLGGGA